MKEKAIPKLLRLNLGKAGTKLKRNVETELLKLTNSEFLSETATAVPRHKTRSNGTLQPRGFAVAA
jgi:hypothetical protein